MKEAVVAEGSEIEIVSFRIEDFMKDEAKSVTIEKITKKEIKHMAKEMGLSVDDEKLAFAKRIVNAYITR